METLAIFNALVKDLQGLGGGLAWLGLWYCIPAVFVSVVAAARVNPTYWRDLWWGIARGLVVGVLAWMVFIFAGFGVWNWWSYKYNNNVAIGVFFGGLALGMIFQFAEQCIYFRRLIRAREARAKDPHAPAKRFWAFSLRQVLLVQIGLALAFALWLGYRREDIRYRNAEAKWKLQEASIQARFGAVGWQIRAQYYSLGLELGQHHRTPLPGFSLAVLKQLTPADRLRFLEIRTDALTDEGLEVIGQHEQITWLDLQSTQVTDKGISHLKNLKSLRHLALDCPQLTEKVLADLAQLESLKYVTLYRSQIPPEQGVEFERAHPGVKVGIYKFMN